MTPTATPPGRCPYCGAALTLLPHIGPSVFLCPNAKCEKHLVIGEAKRIETVGAKP